MTATAEAIAVSRSASGPLVFFSRAGAVTAGVTAAVGRARFGPAAPALIGSGTAALAVFATLLPPHPRTRWSR
ncbi:hypothetical protein [Streptomyces deccanensis]|uniref:hypothetical protein n=1 Tax=Streptomyces deccanensis TaxID=424188 RepID=UPI001EFC077A|nr:hypothetical protein [Streptomyces deccanensis]ULR48344.1 hypothetical protein L3078_03060 [Streptomyces deccanensis]